MRLTTDGNLLVSVVVPAFNAARHILEALHSISQQSHRTLEVIVVDDGSTDDTAVIARQYSAHDPRFRVLSKANGGVASARNLGIRESNGAFIAFIDADDLWHPTKIAKQLDALLCGGPDMALVYSPFRLVDADGNVLASPHKYGVHGWVIYRHFHTNLVGNGSALLVRKSVLEEFGGFDPSLRDDGAEGCEDLLLQLRIAKRYRFGEVAEYLVGYRRVAGNMSSNVEQMIGSGILAVNKAFAESRDIPGLSASAMLKRYEWQRLKLSVRKGNAGDSLRSFTRQLTGSPAFVANALYMDSVALAKKVRRSVTGQDIGASLRHFYEFDPASGIQRDPDTPVSRALRRLAKFDEVYRPRPGMGATLPLRVPADGPFNRGTLSTFSTKLDRSSTYQEGLR